MALSLDKAIKSNYSLGLRMDNETKKSIFHVCMCVVWKEILAHAFTIEIGNKHYQDVQHMKTHLKRYTKMYSQNYS